MSMSTTTPVHDGLILSPEQTLALDQFNLGHNVFITGPGGTGKTELIRRIVKSCAVQKKTVQVTALTGTAAILLLCKAKTIHSWAGIGICKGDVEDIVSRVVFDRNKTKRWVDTDVLIIDEVSMMSKKIFNVLDLIGRQARKRKDVPFGGLQIVFSGDFFQLPPIGERGEPDTAAFCFESERWLTTFQVVVELKQMFRQTDTAFAKILNQIRIGQLKRSSIDLLNAQLNKPMSVGVIVPPILLPIRNEVDAINAAELAKLTTTAHVFTAKKKIAVETSTSAKAKRQKPTSDEDYAYLLKNIPAEETLVLKVGCQVMCVANVDMESDSPLVNGSQGIVTAFELNGLPIVLFNNGRSGVVHYHTWASEKNSSIGVTQIPLCLAWAITIHKSQGVTLEAAQIDVGNAVFEAGQTYVALSRVKSLDGLYLLSFDPNKIKVNPKVKAYYASLLIKGVEKMPPPSATATLSTTVAKMNMSCVKTLPDVVDMELLYGK